MMPDELRNPGDARYFVGWESDTSRPFFSVDRNAPVVWPPRCSAPTLIQRIRGAWRGWKEGA